MRKVTIFMIFDWIFHEISTYCAHRSRLRARDFFRQTKSLHSCVKIFPFGSLLIGERDA